MSSRSHTNTWTPDKYLQYQDIRERPGIELIDRLLHHYTQIQANNNTIIGYDLGCGTGNLTTILYNKLHQLYTNATINITGIDSSDSMLEKAHKNNTIQSITYKHGDVSESFTDNDRADIIYSNACFQWIHHHNTVYTNLVKQLKPHTGLLAIQIPNNFDNAYHTEITTVLEDLQLIDILPHNDGHSVGHYYSMETHTMEYYDTLLQSHCDIIDIWTTTYNQVLTGQMYASQLSILPTDKTALQNIQIDNVEYYHPVLNFTMGSALTAVLPKLTDQQRTEFLYLYNRRMCKKYPVQKLSDADSNGLVQVRVLFPFQRLFLVAKRR